MLITSHILAELEEIADDVAFLCDGTLRFAGSVAALLEQTREERLEAAVAALMKSERASPKAAEVHRLPIVRVPAPLAQNA